MSASRVLGPLVGSTAVAAVLAVQGAAAVPVSPGPVPPQLPEGEAIAGSAHRGLWFDGAQVRRLPGSAAIGQLPAAAARWPHITRSSQQGVALIAGEQLFSATAWRPPRPVPTARVGCWTAGEPADGAFVAVAGDELVSAAVWSCPSRAQAGRQPIFERKLGGGRWDVVTHVAGRWPPILAGDDDAVAIGVQMSRSRMRVLLVSPTGWPLAPPLLVPDGYLALDGSRGLVVSTPSAPGFPLQPRYDFGFGYAQYGGTGATGSANGLYHLAEYSSVTGRRLRRLGTSATQPLVAHGHMLVSSLAADGNETLTLRSLTTGASRRLIAFSDPGRVMLTDAFTWPTLTLVDTTSKPLPDGQFSCTTGMYSPPTAPTVLSLDVTRARFVPAPSQPAPTPRPPQCGPAPP